METINNYDFYKYAMSGLLKKIKKTAASLQRDLSQTEVHELSKNNKVIEDLETLLELLKQQSELNQYVNIVKLANGSLNID